MTKAGLEQVAVADPLREAIDIYIEALEDDDYDGEVVWVLLLVTALNRYDFVTENIGDYETMGDVTLHQHRCFVRYAQEQGSCGHKSRGANHMLDFS